MGNTPVPDSGSELSVDVRSSTCPGDTSTCHNDDTEPKSSPTPSSVYAETSGENSDTGPDSDFELASSLDSSDIEVGAVECARAVVIVGQARLIQIPPRSTNNEHATGSTGGDPKPQSAEATKAAGVTHPSQARLVKMQPCDNLRGRRSISAGSAPSRPPPASATSPELRQPLPTTPQGSLQVRNARPNSGGSCGELRNYHKQRQMDEARRYEMNVNRMYSSPKQPTKSESSPPLYNVPMSDDSGSTHDGSVSYEYEQTVRRMGGMSPMAEKWLQDLPAPPTPPSPALLGSSRKPRSPAVPTRPLANSGTFSSASSVGSTPGSSLRLLHSNSSASPSPSRARVSPRRSRLSPSQSGQNLRSHPPPSLHRVASNNLTASPAHRLSLVPESAENEEEADTNLENDPLWAPARQVVEARQADVRDRILEQVKLFEKDEAKAKVMAEFILNQDDAEVDACAYGEKSVEAVKKKVLNLQLVFQVLNHKEVGPCLEDTGLMIQTRFKRKVRAVMQRMKAEAEADKAKDKGKGKATARRRGHA
ncbi:hypothetical protein F5Y06DRAFT_306830 [Hypoxylon sp. FL0890]|nr:hypothetical protein F5Y06DRAFT_306830 [Hypoxylon sp. FL0890]